MPIGKTINLIQITAAIFLLFFAMRVWFRVWRTGRPANHGRVGLALLLTDLFVMIAGILRLYQILFRRIPQGIADDLVWFFGLGIAIVQFALSRGWFLDLPPDRHS